MINVIIKYGEKEVSFLDENEELRDYISILEDAEALFGENLNPYVINKLVNDLTDVKFYIGNDWHSINHKNNTISDVYDALEALINVGDEEDVEIIFDYFTDVLRGQFADITDDACENILDAYIGNFPDKKEVAIDHLRTKENFSYPQCEYIIMLTGADVILEEAGIVKTANDNYFYKV